MAQGAFNNFGKVAAALPKLIQQVVDKTALDLEAGYKSMIRSYSFKGTGNMLNSAYSVTSKGSTWAVGYERLQPPSLSQKFQAFAGIAASYAIYINMGTVHYAAHPFFEPTNERVGRGLDSAMQAVAKKLEDMGQ